MTKRKRLGATSHFTLENALVFMLFVFVFFALCFGASNIGDVDGVFDVGAVGI